MSEAGGLKNLQDAIGAIYLIKDPYITKLMVATVISQFLPSDPVWVVIVAPSGGCKSEFVNMISYVHWTPPGENKMEQSVHPMSTLTPRTFVSGMKGQGRDNSLLLQISNGIITFKDLTSLLSEHKDDRAVIMAQLREIYDGKYSKSFGTGEQVNWVGKITILAGATYAIHSMKQSYTAMGERFIFYNMIQPERSEAAQKTMENQEEGLMAQHREELAVRFSAYAIDVLNSMPKSLPKINKELRVDMISLAELATRARSDVERNWRSPQQEIIEVHPPEMPTRFAGQLQTMVQALKIINHKETGNFDLYKEDTDILHKLALDSVTKMRRIIMQELAKYTTIETAGLALRLGLPTNSVRRYVEDLAALEIVDREKGGGSRGDRWILKDKYRALMEKFEGTVMTHTALTEANAEVQAELTIEEQFEIAERLQEEADDAAMQRQQQTGMI